MDAPRQAPRLEGKFSDGYLNKKTFDFFDWVSPHQLSTFLQARSRWRQLAAPVGPSEVRRTERWLATAIVSLAVSALFGVWMYPSQISWWAHWLLGIYIIHGVVVMLLFRFNKRSTPAFRAWVHAADLMWPASIYVFPKGRDLFFPFLFVLAAAAYQWGLWETIGTAAGSLTLLWLESDALRHGHLLHWMAFLSITIGLSWALI